MIHETAYIHPTAVIYPGVTIGAGAYIGPLCIIGAPAEMGDMFGIPGLGVEIAAGAMLTGAVTVDSGTTRKTSIGPNCFLMKGAHLGHDVVLGMGVIVSCGAKIGGHCWIMAQANIGLNAVVHQWQVVGAHAMVGMGAVVTKGLDVQPFKTFAGNPARELGWNKKWDRIRADEDRTTDINAEYARIKSFNHG